MKNKLAFVLLGIIALIIAVATILEKKYGTKFVIEQVYTAWWMCALWFLMVLAGVFRCLQTQMWKRPSVFILHLSFVVILTGALVTHITSIRGYIHIRNNETTQCFFTPEGTVKKLPFYLCLDSFQIQKDKSSEDIPIDYVSYVMVRDKKGDENATISMNKPLRCKGYRIYQTSYDDDLQGSVFTVMFDPWGIGITYIGYALLALSMIVISLKKMTNFSLNYTFIIGALFASYMLIGLFAQPLMPVLRSPMLFVHVGTIMISYCLLVVSFFNQQVLRPAVFTLAAGIFLGAMWANISWGTYWSWDPKESWALITLIVYAIPLHTKTFPWFQSTRNYRIYSFFAFLCLIMTYFGVNYFLGGMHAYMN